MFAVRGGGLGLSMLEGSSRTERMPSGVRPHAREPSRSAFGDGVENLSELHADHDGCRLFNRSGWIVLLFVLDHHQQPYTYLSLHARIFEPVIMSQINLRTSVPWTIFWK